MKKGFIYIVFVLSSLAGYAQTVEIPDPAFLAFLKRDYQQVIDNTSEELIISEAEKITSNISGMDEGIANLEGIQYFSNVTKINFANNAIVSIPSLLPMTELETV